MHLLALLVASVVSATTLAPFPDDGSGALQAVSIVAGAGAANTVVVDRSPDATIVYDAAGARPGAGCRSWTPAEVRCPGPKLGRVDADLGDGDDRLQLDATAILTADGGPGADRLVAGGFGTAMLTGGAGDDLLIGGAGSDLIDGGLGADEMIGGAGTDRVSYEGRTAPVHLDREGDADDGAAGEGDRIGVDVERLWGGDADDVIVGSSRADEIDGEDGDDTITGLGGPDRLEGSLGDDRIDGGAGRDSIAGGDGIDSIAAGPGVDDVDGGGSLDAISGGPGRDTLDGRDGGADVFAQDGEFDFVTCSRDGAAGQATLDAPDLVRGCVGVTRTGVARPRLLLLGQSDLDADNAIRLSLACPQDIAPACTGRLRISRRGRTLTHRPLRIRAGSARLFRPRVPRRLALTHGNRCPHNPVRITITLRDGSGSPFTIRRRYTVINTALFCTGATLRDDFTTGWD